MRSPHWHRLRAHRQDFTRRTLLSNAQLAHPLMGCSHVAKLMALAGAMDPAVAARLRCAAGGRKHCGTGVPLSFLMLQICAAVMGIVVLFAAARALAGSSDVALLAAILAAPAALWANLSTT
jgi:hypothetical protein